VPREEGGLIFPYAPCAVPRPGQVAPIDSPITGYVVAYSTLELTTMGGGAGAGGVGGGAGGTRERWERGEVVVAENVANPAVTLRGLRADTQYVGCAGAVCSAFKLTSRPLLPSWERGKGPFQQTLRTRSLCVWAPFFSQVLCRCHVLQRCGCGARGRVDGACVDQGATHPAHGKHPQLCMSHCAPGCTWTRAVQAALCPLLRAAPCCTCCTVSLCIVWTLAVYAALRPICIVWTLAVYAALRPICIVWTLAVYAALRPICIVWTLAGRAGRSPRE
jgi:hypothetical protein